VAAANGKVECILELVKAGADINLKDVNIRERNSCNMGRYEIKDAEVVLLRNLLMSKMNLTIESF